MKRIYVLIGLFLILIIFITILGSFFVTGNIEIREDKDIFLVQSNKEVYFNVYGYSIDNPNVIVNPYGNSPLTAIVMFETDDYSEVEIIIKSKNGDSDIYYKFDKDKYHMIPIYGLYADYDNTVIIKSEGVENTIHIKTDKLPDDFVYVENSSRDNFMFYNGNYPYATDINGDVRWYLNSNYYGNITMLDNSNIIIGSDKYDEEGNVISIYKMNLLGKIYNEYLLKDSYYGYNVILDDNILVLSDDILLIDSQTGDVLRTYGENDDYDYLGLYEDDIVVGKEGVFYKVLDDSLEETMYSSSSGKHGLYDNTSNYKITIASRLGSLGETPVSGDNITLVNYDSVKELSDISIERDINRIKVVNNTGETVYLILDKFLDKRIYAIRDVRYINSFGLDGKYTVFYKIGDKLYKTDYYIEV